MSSKFKSHDATSKPGASKPPVKAALKPVKKAEQPAKTQPAKTQSDKVEEIGGPSGPEPTRYGDWEVNGRCVDF